MKKKDKKKQDQEIKQAISEFYGDAKKDNSKFTISEERLSRWGPDDAVYKQMMADDLELLRQFEIHCGSTMLEALNKLELQELECYLKFNDVDDETIKTILECKPLMNLYITKR